MKLLTLIPIVLLAGCQSSGTETPTSKPPASESATPDKSKPEHYVGKYWATAVVGGKPMDMSMIPIGQRPLFELKADSTWVIKDLMSMMQGTWKMKDGTLVLTEVKEANGKDAKPNELIFKPTPDRSRLVGVPKKGEDGWMEFTYDPESYDKIDKAIQDAVKDIPRN